MEDLVQELLKLEKERADRALAEAQSYKLALDEHSNVAKTDLAGRITEVNSLFVQISGYSEAELIGRTHAIIKSGVHPNSFYTEMWKTILSGNTWRGEICNRAKDGRLYWLDSSIMPLFGQDGKIEGYIAIRTDITARKQFEAELQHAKEAAEAATQAKGQFLANMSHELRTPLTAILGYAEQLLDPAIEHADRIDCTNTVLNNAHHLLDIVNDILDFSKIEAGKLVINVERVDLFALIDFVESALGARAKDKGLALAVEFDFPLPQYIETDPLRLKQILLNLIGNAIKFTEQGGVKLIVGFDQLQAKVTFSVVDTGIGISNEQMKGLFQVFSQADSSTTKNFGGTGLGLAISKRLALVLGGDITVESRHRQGSTFTLVITSGKVQDQDLRNEHIGGDVVPLSSWPDSVSVKGSVLLAEDCPDNQRLIRRLLEKSGLEVHVAADGPTAMTMALSRNFGLVLMDMQMPLVDGYTATRQLRAVGYKAPIIACTADASQENMIRLLEIGCSDVLFKPFTAAALGAVVEKHLGQKSDPAGCAECGIGLSESEIVELQRGFISRMPQRLVELRSAHGNCAWDEISRIAHKLAAATMFGLPQLAHVAKELELGSSKAKEKSPEEIYEKLLRLCESLSAQVASPG